MPGILPMKVIKVGNSSQSRVAQACDRCRSKKIRCDGVRPCCSQCANVGFECKTSDKLSRRAFPRGYTESLEDRVRSLEAEVRELKCLLDEKDEKIDVLSRLHSFSPSSRKSSSASVSASASSSIEENAPPPSSNNDRDDLIQVHQPTSVLRKPTHDSPFTGPSSTKAFIDAFLSKLEKSGRSPAAVSVDALLSPPSLSAWKRQDTPPKTPPRLVSDQLLNIFFQEWAPLYPVVHRPAILKLYGRYTTNPDSVEDDKYALAQLNLIFGIAAISSTARVPQDPSVFERNWVPKLEVLANDISLTALQCYILAQIYYSIKSDYKSLLRYRGIGVSICLQLGLHQSQKKFSFNPLMGETRKKIFWCQYTLDRFSAALTGLPTIMAEADISTEYPANVDDENVTETGFVPTPPEEATRMSSALALFSVSRILNKVLERLYPSSTGYEISLSTIHSLAEELEDWLKKLPAHLRLEFAQDKPSASTTSSRSPLLSIVFYYIRTLIRRPAVCFGKPNNASPSMLSLVDSGKHIIQLLKLLDERRMSLAISINKRELVFVTGLSILWQSMDLSRESKLVKEGQKVLTTAINLLESESADAAAEFGAILSSVVQMDIPRRNSASSLQLNREMSAPTLKSNSPKRQLEPLRTQFSFSSEARNSAQLNNDIRRASGPNMSPGLSRSVRSSSSHSLSSVEEHARSLKIQCISAETASDGSMNLDYMPISDEKDKKQVSSSYGPGMGMSEWEHVLSDIDSGHANIFTGIYGGSECGQTPAAFATLGSNFQQHQQQQHQHHHQHQRHQQQHQQSSPVSILPSSSARSMNEWSPEPWSSTSSNGLPQAHPTTTTASGSTITATQPNFQEERRLPSRDGGVTNGTNAANGMDDRLNPVQHRNSISRAPPLDPYEAIVIPHNMDTMDTSNDFNVAENWVPQCVM